MKHSLSLNRRPRQPLRRNLAFIEQRFSVGILEQNE